MEFIFYCFCLLMLFFSYKVTKDCFNPLFISASVWLVISYAYNLVINRTGIWYPLSIQLYLYIIVYLLSMFVTSFSMIQKKRTKKVITHIVLGNKYNYLLTMAIIIMSLTDLYLLNLVHSVGYMKVRGVLEEGVPIVVKLGSYANPLLNVLICYGIFGKKSKRQLYKIILATFLLVVNIFCMASKGGIFQLFICIIFMLHAKGKLTKKNILILLTVLIISVFALQAARAGDEAKSDNFITKILYIYILSPLPALDMLVTHKLDFAPNGFSGATLGFIQRFLQKIFNISFASAQVNNWVAVPYLTNVYSILGPYYIDYKFCGGIISGIIYGFIYGRLYFRLKNYNDIYAKCFYAVWLYCLVFQFFGEWFFGFFSITLQSMFWLFIITRKIKI